MLKGLQLYELVCAFFIELKLVQDVVCDVYRLSETARTQKELGHSLPGSGTLRSSKHTGHSIG
jgi:hypothetical protein